MNSTIRKLYTFRKKEKSFDKTFGAKYVQDLLNNMIVQKIDFSSTQENCKTEEDIDLDDLIINEIPIIEDPLPTQQNDLISPRKKFITYDSDIYRLIYRFKKRGNNKVLVIPCKVSKRSFKMSAEDLRFQEDFDKLQLEFQQLNELDFLTPFNEFYQKVNEIILSQL